jgi:hypothetical protein
MKIKWKGEPSESGFLKLVLAPGNEYDVPKETAEAWVASGVAEFVRESKSRRVAAPESADKE